MTIRTIDALGADEKRISWWMPVCLLAVAAVLASTACVHARSGAPLEPTPTAPPRLTPQAERVTDEAIGLDYRTFEALQARVRALNAGGVALANYQLAKAQAYLDLAFDEYHENDRSLVTDLALGEADRLLGALEARTPEPSLATYRLEGDDRERAGRPTGTPVPENRLRPDLWALAERLKLHPQFACAAAPTAQFEVALLHAIHEDHDGGWRRARPYLEAAEALAARAQAGLDACPAAAPRITPQER